MEAIFEDGVHEMLVSMLTKFLLEYALKKKTFCKFISSFSACMNSKWDYSFIIGLHRNNVWCH